MLSVSNLNKSYELNTILKDVSFTLNAGERLGLVGPNGCGKTTLLRILAGEEKPDSGVVRRTAPDVRTGYLAQGFVFDADETVGSFLARSGGDALGPAAKLEELARALAENPLDEALQEEYDAALALVSADSSKVGRTAAVLAGLGLGAIPLETPAEILSGGQKTRLALAGVLLDRPQLLLLDEPTNHLDFGMLQWLESWLRDFRGAALVVSHDRAFLDRMATGILEIDPLTHAARIYPGNYSFYVGVKEAERERQWQAYQDQRDKIARLRKAAAHVRSNAHFHKGGKADPGNTDGLSAGFFADRGKETVQKAKNMEKRIERMLTEDRIDKPARSWQARISFGGGMTSGRDVLATNDLAVGYDGKQVLGDVYLRLRLGERAVLVGANGSGKTTLLRTLAGRLAPLSGEVRLGSNVRTGYMAQEQENLDPGQDAFTALAGILGGSQTEVRAFLAQYLFTGDEVFAPAGRLSYGERSRLALALLAAQGCNLLLLDEPLNHLDIPSRVRFEQALSGFEGTVLAVAHDRYFIASFARTVWEVADGVVRVVWSPEALFENAG